MTINNTDHAVDEPTANDQAGATGELSPSPRVSSKPKRVSALAANPGGMSHDGKERSDGSIKAAKAPPTKTSAALKLLRSTKGVTLDTLMTATGWQAHSVRGFLSGTVRKKLGLGLMTSTAKDGTRRYRIVEIASAE